jgi:hypothetical protein
MATMNCPRCGGRFSKSLSDAFQEIANEPKAQRSAQVRCTMCGAHLTQWGYCEPCDRFTWYVGGPCPEGRNVCSSCGSRTLPPQIVSI